MNAPAPRTGPGLRISATIQGDQMLAEAIRPANPAPAIHL
jgi:hypothetical protein